MKNRINLQDYKTKENHIFFNEDIRYLNYKDEVSNNGLYIVRVNRTVGSTINLAFETIEQRNQALGVLDFYMHNQNEPIKQQAGESAPAVNDQVTDAPVEHIEHVEIEHMHAAEIEPVLVDLESKN